MKISVITVCLNRVDMIEKTIQSVINQAYAELEYIIIDGGSSDGTVDIIKKYEGVIAYWVSEADAGIYDAMNKGVARATGDVVAFLNSDDWYEDNTLTRVADYFKQYHPMILSGKQNVLQKGQWKKQTLEFDEKEASIRVRMNCRHPATFVKRELFDRFGGFDTQYQIAADYDWMLRMYDAGIRILKVDDVFTNFSSKGISSTNLELTIKETRQIALLALDRNTELSTEEKEGWRGKIYELYNSKHDFLEIKKIIQNNQIGNFPNVRIRMLDCFTEKAYVIWGRGIIGEEVHSLLLQLGLHVKYFLDSHVGKAGERFHDLPVKLPQAVMHDEKIIVASTEYEDEIVCCLGEMGFEENKDYITYSKLFNQLVAAYQTGMKENNYETDENSRT